MPDDAEGLGRRVALKPGWARRQFAKARREVKRWPLAYQRELERLKLIAARKGGR